MINRPIKIVEVGDRTKTTGLRKRGEDEMKITKEQAKFQGLDQYWRTVRPEPGVVIKCSLIYGQENVIIYAEGPRPRPEDPRPKKDGLIKIIVHLDNYDTESYYGASPLDYNPYQLRTERSSIAAAIYDLKTNRIVAGGVVNSPVLYSAWEYAGFDELGIVEMISAGMFTNDDEIAEFYGELINVSGESQVYGNGHFLDSYRRLDMQESAFIPSDVTYNGITTNLLPDCGNEVQVNIGTCQPIKAWYECVAPYTTIRHFSWNPSHHTMSPCENEYRRRHIATNETDDIIRHSWAYGSPFFGMFYNGLSGLTEGPSFGVRQRFYATPIGARAGGIFFGHNFVPKILNSFRLDGLQDYSNFGKFGNILFKNSKLSAIYDGVAVNLSWGDSDGLSMTWPFRGLVSVKGYFGKAQKESTTLTPGFTEAIRRTIASAAANNGATVYEPTTAPDYLAAHQLSSDDVSEIDVRATAGTVYMNRPIRTIRIQLVEVEL